MTGSRGLVGRALTPALEAAGHTVTPLLRPGSPGSGIRWDPDTGSIEAERLQGQDAVVHLAGETIFGLFTRRKKQRIRASRERGTQLIASTLAGLDRPPGVLVSASGIHYYGSRPASESVDEESAPGRGFMAEVVAAWERAADPARAAGIRVVHPRFAPILSRHGGMLQPMLPVFRAGLGGTLGNGEQIWSWVAIDDVVSAIQFALATPSLEGPVNVVAPLAVTNKAFTRTLGRVLRRPTIVAVPAFLLEAVAGELAREMMLWGARVVPRKLQGAGFKFGYPELESALRHILRES